MLRTSCLLVMMFASAAWAERVSVECDVYDSKLGYRIYYPKGWKVVTTAPPSLRAPSLPSSFNQLNRVQVVTTPNGTQLRPNSAETGKFDVMFQEPVDEEPGVIIVWALRDNHPITDRNVGDYEAFNGMSARNMRESGRRKHKIGRRDVGPYDALVTDVTYPQRASEGVGNYKKRTREITAYVPTGDRTLILEMRGPARNFDDGYFAKYSAVLERFDPQAGTWPIMAAIGILMVGGAAAWIMHMGNKMPKGRDPNAPTEIVQTRFNRGY